MRKIIFNPFEALASWVARNLGHPLAFILATLTIIVWGITGPFCGYSDTWMLWVNTGTTIVTFLAVFLLQNSSNRSSDELMEEISELKQMIRDLKKHVDS